MLSSTSRDKINHKKNIRDPVSTYRSKNIVSKHNSHVPPFFHLRYESRIIVVPSRFIDHPNFSAPFFPFLHHRITNDIIIPLPPFTFFSPFLSIFSILPWTDGYVCTISVRVTQRPLNPRRSIKLEREVEAAPSLPPSLPSSPWWV